MSPEIQALVVALLSSLITSSGFWAYLQNRGRKKDEKTRLLMNLAAGKIIRVGMIHCHNGWITKDEFDELQTDLYGPYLALGGNGLAKRIMDDVARLPLTSPERYARIDGQNRMDPDGD